MKKATKQPTPFQFTLRMQGQSVQKKDIGAHLGYPADGRLFRYDIREVCAANPAFAETFAPYKRKKRIPASVALELVQAICPFAVVKFALSKPSKSPSK